ncbi:MAG: FAD-dependent monooxygenase, partial [Burkholderiales bacterium]
MNSLRHDAIVVGGGPIGCALACALEGSGRQVLVLEAQPSDRRAPDARTLALSWGSRLILERLDAWSACDSATPIRSIDVSQRGRFGRTELTADDVQLPALGYVLPHAMLYDALLERLRRSVDAKLRHGAEVTDLSPDDDSVLVTCRIGGDSHSLRARLVIVADGGAWLGKKVGVHEHTRDYNQSAVVGIVKTSEPHRNRAYERFTPDGPVALLPRADAFALVWSCTRARAPGLQQLEKSQFLQSLQRHFGNRAGKFLDIGERASFPLSLRFVRNPVQSRVVLLGNAAQSLHPIAGQGFNLGLRDAWELADAIGHEVDTDPGSERILSLFR